MTEYVSCYLKFVLVEVKNIFETRLLVPFRVFLEHF